MRCKLFCFLLVAILTLVSIGSISAQDKPVPTSGPRAEFIQTHRLEMPNSIEAELARRAAQVVAYSPEMSFPV